MDVARFCEELLADEDPDRALTLCADRLREAGLSVERRDELGALVAQRGEGGLALSGHVDVVPVNEEEWSQAPFGAELREDRVYGRGASDMRGPVASMLAAVEETTQPVQVVLTTDEETTLQGVRALVDEGVLADADLIVVGEPTGLDVAAAGKGLVWARVQVEGARGHASTPRGGDGRGPSAPERLVEALSQLEPRPLKIEHPRLGSATLAVSGIESEATPFNVLAGEAEARLDVRFPPPKTPEDVERSLRSRMGLPREGLEIAFEKREPAFLGDEGLARQVLDVLDTMAGLEGELTGVDYVTEAGHWQRVGDVLVVGPGSIDRAHAPDEYVTIDELEAGREAYAALIEAWGA